MEEFKVDGFSPEIEVSDRMVSMTLFGPVEESLRLTFTLDAIPHFIEALAGCLSTARLASQPVRPLPAKGWRVSADTRGNRVEFEWVMPGGASLATLLAPATARSLAASILEQLRLLDEPPASKQ